ncbi:MAG TPA: roadblock/LC7 domain-containing protein [Thermodesulfobacteriota bacterium]|nr:roadblock/LC7 domain-containing protein [Thermodesulfobacteriota bacterium]
MTFTTVLRELVDTVPGSQAGFLMGLDGIPIDACTAPAAQLDPQQAAAEYAAVLTAARRAAEALDAGQLEELAVTTERGTLLARTVTPEYVVALALAPGGHRGRGRFRLRLASLRLAAELA